MRSLTFTGENARRSGEICRGRGRRSVAPVSSACAARSTILMGSSALARQTLWICLKSHNATGRPAHFDDLQGLWPSLAGRQLRVRELTRGGYKEQVRGYCRDARNRQPTHCP